MLFYFAGTQRASRSINVKLVDSVLGSTLRSVRVAGLGFHTDIPTFFQLAWRNSNVAYHHPMHPRHCDCWWQSLLVVLGCSWINHGNADQARRTCSLHAHLSSSRCHDGHPRSVHRQHLSESPNVGQTREEVSSAVFDTWWSPNTYLALSNAKSPVLAHFGAAITGLGVFSFYTFLPFSLFLIFTVSIRAYGAQQPFANALMKKIDHYVKVSRTSYNLNRWIGIRVDVLGATFATALASYLLIRRSISAANIGFSLNMSIDFCTLILWLVRNYNELEVQSNRWVLQIYVSRGRVNRSFLVSNVSKVISKSNMNQSQPKQVFLQRRGLKAVNFKLNIFLLDILRYAIVTVINTPTLISVSRLVQRYYTIFLSISNQVKGLELVNQDLRYMLYLVNWLVDLLFCFQLAGQVVGRYIIHRLPFVRKC